MELEESGKEAYKTIPAGLVGQGDTLEGLYRRMVDENLVRKDISFGEMAELARNYAAGTQTDCNDPDKAVAILYKSAGYQKRSYIRAFVTLLDEIGDALEHAHAIPRSLGLNLRKPMEETPGIAAKIKAELAQWHDRPITDELGVLRKYAGGAGR